MEHRDALVSDITVVLKPHCVDKIKEAVQALNDAGMGISSVNEDVGAVEGSCDSNRIAAIQQLDCVDAVRTTFSYVADYPVGDPRDRDGPEPEE